MFNGIAFFQSENLDIDVINFIAATNISDTTIINGLQTFVVGMKNNNLWIKMKTIYPFLGGTSSTHKYNLINPNDSDAAYRLLFSGTFTHSMTGVYPNGGRAGENTEAKTHLNVTDLSQSDLHLSVYSRTDGGPSINAAGPVEIGVSSSQAKFYLATCYSNSSNNYITNLNNSGLNNKSYGNGVGKGFYISTRISSANYRIFRNGVIGATYSIASQSPTSDDIYLFKNRSIERSNKELCFASLGNGLTNDEAVTFSDLVNTFQNTLSRNVY